MKTRRSFIAAAVLAVAGALAVSASGQVKAGGAAADAALYAGADRLQKLVAGAKKEGALTIYTSAQTNDLGAVVSAFEKNYGIDVSVWRAGSENVLNRVLQESRANRHTVDIVETNGPELESMHREQILQLVKSPHHADLIAPAIRPHGEWVGTRLNVFVQAYNTRLVKKEELPKTWEDLLRPEVEGKARHRAGGLRLARRRVQRDRRGARHEGVQGDCRDQPRLGAEGAHVAHPARGLGRGPARAHGLQLQGAAAASRRARRSTGSRSATRLRVPTASPWRAGRPIRTPPSSSTTSS